jgi:hypothetical protein
MVSQVDEQQVAMVTFAMHPSGESDGLANLVGAQDAARVGPKWRS